MRIIPILFSTPMVKAILEGRKTQTRRVVKPQPGDHPNDDGYMTSILSRCRYQPGDILWVRETWREMGIISEPYAYKADETPLALVGESGNILMATYRYKPSIHMPREAARLFLLVEDVRVERLQNISEEDAVKEGCRAGYESSGDGKFEDVIEHEWTARENFYTTWQELYAKKYPRKSNPWVWVISYERTERPVTP